MTDPEEAANSRVEELQTIEDLWHVPIIIGETGYSNKMSVDDETQSEVIKAELDAISQLSYVSGLNYWVGPGSDTAGGYTYVFQKNDDTHQWEPRPAAYDLAAFYEEKLK